MPQDPLRLGPGMTQTHNIWLLYNLEKKLHILHYLKIGIMTVRGTDTQVQNYLCKPNGRLNCEG